jgi:K+-transporting ATPase ATPase C chain
MLRHLRANLWLLVFTLFLCSLAYPLVLWAIGQAVFPAQAEGSLMSGPEGKPIGSRLIAQPFSGKEYFQPRPSAVVYNAAASGASNWAASNYQLRDRVARQLGPVVRYRGRAPDQGPLVAPEVIKFFQDRPGIVAEWANRYPTSAQAWVNADDKHKAEVTRWMETHTQAVAEWKAANPDGGEPKPADLATAFFTDNSTRFHAEWPKLIDDATWTVPAVFFDMWRQANPNADLNEVPADAVMASGSGLDPHITLKNAELFQLDRVASEWATKTGRDLAEVRGEIQALLREKAEAPLGGLVGEKLVNVLEVNLAMRERVGRRAFAAR